MTTSESERALEYPLRATEALEPPAEWAELRQQCPVAPVRLPSGDEATLLTRYDDVRQVLADPRFSRQLTDDGAARLTNESTVFERQSQTPMTGEAHQRWRAEIVKWFTAKRMNTLRPTIAAMAESLVDEMVARGRPVDLVAGLGYPLPVQVICHILGVPLADRERFGRWAAIALSFGGHSQDEVQRTTVAYTEYMAGLIAGKRAEAADDLLTKLAAATDDGRMSEAQLLATGFVLLGAGHETTANMIGKMVAMLLADRRRWERLVADRSLIRSTVEESLRVDANPGFGMPRFIAEDIEVGDTVVPAGTTVICSTAAANRDEGTFPDAETMDLARTPNPHVAFGVGPHSCIGQALARTELQCVLDVLLRRLPSLALAVSPAELRRREGYLAGGLEEVPVRW